jgi:hypothetical protein
MIRSRHRHPFLAAVLLAPMLSAAEDSGDAQDIKEIRQVMNSFHQAVTTHNGKRLASLFILEGSTWLNVLSDEAYERAKAKSPTTTKIRVSSYDKFARFVSESKATLDPKHSHVKIQTDGTIATVYFDFEFLIDGKAQNRGAETWQLVKGSEGWQIAAITYSSNPHEL